MNGSGTLALITSTKGIIASGVIGLTAAAAATAISIAPVLTPPSHTQSAPQQDSSTAISDDLSSDLDLVSQGEAGPQKTVYTNEDSHWITPADEVTPPQETESVPAPGMVAPEFSFKPGSVLDPNVPALSGESLPFATITVVLSSDTASHGVFSTQASEVGAWEIALPNTPGGAYTAWAYQELNNKRSDARSTEFKFEGVPGTAPIVIVADTENGKYSPTVSGTGDPGAIVYVKLNGVKNEATVSQQGTWAVTTTNGGLVGTNKLLAVQFNPKTLVFSQQSHESEFELQPPSAQVSGTAAAFQVSVVSEVGSAIDLKSLDGKFSHRIRESLGNDDVSLRRTGSGSSSGPAPSVKARYVSNDGSRTGPWSVPGL
ncbi:hypothetical protein G7068_08995 [Leucobacter viscericola]|uniref:Bacterial Ig domain-containing protein n=1 Tax=Leucobacter viscericola TaxID=2714935 RepID=A0A6G7XFV2_9MICO|nr:hypothetical protein [Leucobacter viscericola]QIK63319.1 hypothetical protein G7068_08995 [Leucobacter viscericola]